VKPSVYEYVLGHMWIATAIRGRNFRHRGRFVRNRQNWRGFL